MKVDQFTKLPVEHDTIQRVISITDNVRRKVSRDPEFRRGNIVVSSEKESAELNIRKDTHLIQPTHDAHGQAIYLDPHVGSSRMSDVVAVDELITTTAGEDESEPPPALPIAPTETSIDILQPSQVIYHPRPTRTLRLPTTQLMLQLRRSKNQN